MVVGYVFIGAAPSTEFGIYTKLLEIPQIKDVHVLFGEYDLIAKIESDSYNQLADLVEKEIRDIDGIVNTKTAPEFKMQ
ncbi:MAG: Lrp/AsnC ligand binding domain-containing protein [Thermoplasmata archaeon]|nr:MAG: Lrp/AsnC ligand binding domain-containing protein [Candidatus Aminicenantes bacterium]UCG35567.1 MAG: Lrp/AsnC ligand binding domain-containing protein [Candidatus Omnitrophota bacterium]UCH89745.1 MAG: Lrp/AsnC ligand binding domain-containing protein [Thermoplasmata archaeon]